jgi:methyltransferase family protein
MSPRVGNAAFKLTRHFVYPFWAALTERYLRVKYRSHRFEHSFQWDWEKINYNRIALVNLLISRMRDPAYLEIGCQSNNLYDSVPCNQKTGVDPVAGGNVRATSDEFFSANKRSFDLIFIDGLHTYEQARRDVINSLKFLKPGGYIALHDMLPESWIEHHVPRLSDAWTGDVWKVAFELSQSKGIDFKIVKIDHGVGVLRVTGAQPELQDAGRELQGQEFEYLYENVSRLPIISWQDFVSWAG